MAAIVAPFIMTLIGSKFPNTTFLLFMLCVGSGSSLPLMAYINDFWGLWTLFFFYNFCVFSIFPIHMALGLELCGDKGNNKYFVFRAIGTLGFVVGCVLCSWLSRYLDFKGLYILLSASYFLAVAFIWMQAQHQKQSNLKPPAVSLSGFIPTYKKALKIFTEPGFSFLVFIIFLASLANTLAIGVQGNYIVHNFEGNPSLVSLSWVVCSGFEIPIMFICMFLLKRYSIGAVLLAGLAGTFLRINIMALAPNINYLFLGLSLHGFFYAGITTGLGIRIHNSPHIERAASQSFISLFYTGLPSVIGGFFSGFIWEHFSLKSVYVVAQIIVCLAALLWTYFYFKGKSQLDLKANNSSQLGLSESNIS